MNPTNTPVPEGKMVREILKNPEISRIGRFNEFG